MRYYPLCVLVASEKQLFDEQKQSIEFRKRRGWRVPEYGYVIVSDVSGNIRWTSKSAQRIERMRG